MNTSTLVVAAVNSKNSINLDLASKISYAGDYGLLDLSDLSIPFLSNELLEKKAFPKEIESLNEELNKYSKIIFVTPEHNGNYTAFFKNILDWLSRLDNKYLTNKKVAVVVASPGVKGGQSLRSIAATSLPFTGAEVIGTYGFGEYNLDKDVTTEVEKLVSAVENA